MARAESRAHAARARTAYAIIIVCLFVVLAWLAAAAVVVR